MVKQSKLFEDWAYDYKTFFKEEIVYRPDLEKIFSLIRHMNYDEFMEFRVDFMRFYEQITEEFKTAEAKNKFWERVIQEIESKFQFKRPQSMTKAADHMRRLRARRGY